MELQFLKKELAYLHRVLWEVKNEEYTQELKLPESLPDIGKILGIWGQPVIRGKEWRGNGMGANGGFMVWVLYQPEDGSEPRMLDTWIPFQTRWDFPQTQRDGTMRVNCCLGSMDGRSTSPRKLIVRAVAGVTGEALEPVRCDIYSPGEMEPDIQVLRRSYPVCLPTEAGEKAMALDEELKVPASCGIPRKVLYCTLQPEPVEKKVMGDKVVFRGSVLVQCMVMCADGTLKSLDFDVPFSQYADLDREYDSYASADVLTVVTGLETQLQEDGSIRMKAGLTGQYVIYDQPTIEIVEDAYSTSRTVDPQVQLLQLPAVLEIRQQTVQAEHSVEPSGETPMDAVFYTGNPQLSSGEQGMEMGLSGMFQLLTAGDNGMQCQNIRWEENQTVPTGENVKLLTRVGRTGKTQFGGTAVQADICVEWTAVSNTNIPMVTGLEVGEKLHPDENRPSLILCRPGGESLWEIAKRCGSTVNAIQEANDLQEEPLPERMILIPVN